MASRVRIIIASCSVTYLSLGIAGAALGPLLPELSHRTGIALSGAGLILSFYYLGGILSRLVAGMLRDRFGSTPVVIGGLTVEVCAAVVLTMSRAPAVLYAGSFLLGGALGSGLLGAVLIAAKLVPDRSVSLVNLVNAFWGIGSIVGPALFSAISASTRSGLPVIWIAGLIGIAAIALLLRGGTRSGAPTDETDFALRADVSAEAGRPPGAGLLRVPDFWLFGSILLFDVGTESTIGGWAAVYLQHSVPIRLQLAALVVSGFYVSFTLARMITAGVGSRVAARWVLSCALVFALGGMGLVSATPGRLVPSVVGFLLGGLGIGPIYPTITALVSRRFGARAGTAVGLSGSLGFVGGVVFPWISGALMPTFGPAVSMRMSEALIVVVAALSYLGVMASRRRRVSGGSLPGERD